MPDIIISHGGNCDGYITVSVNGDAHLIPTGVLTTVDEVIPEVLDHAMISYALATSGAEPLVVADFKNGVYQIDGSDVMIDDIFEETPPEAGWWSGWTADPQAGVGLVDTNFGHNPQLAAAAKALVIGGCTMVRTFNCEANGHIQLDLLQFPDYTVDLGFNTVAQFLSVNGQTVEAAPFDTPSAETLNKIAFTAADGVIAISINGGETVSADPGVAVAGVATDIAMVFLNCTVEQIAFYAPQPAADMQTLSTRN
jgi:hypothetical protein